MKDDFDFVLAEGALDEITVDDIAAHGIDLLNATAAHEFALRNPVAYQADNIRAGVNELLDEPRPEQSRAACDQDRAISPKRIHSDHTFQGVCSLAQSSFRYWYSRYVSMA